MKKIVCKIMCICLVLLLLALAVPTAAILGSFSGRGEPEAEHLIVLGTTVNGTEPSALLKLRLDAAVEYLNTYPAAQCIVTGGKGSEENLSEAQCMYNYLTAAGIDPARITMEDRAETTVENLQNVRAMLGDAEVAILSSDFHLYRAGRIAKDVGYVAALVPAKTEPLSLLIPWFLREIVVLYGYCFG